MAKDLLLTLRLGLVEKVTGVLAKVNRGSQAAAKSLASLRDTNKALEKQLKDVSGYRRMRAEHRALGVASKSLDEKLKKANDTLAEQRNRHTTLKANLEKARYDVMALTRAHSEGAITSEVYNRQLSGLNVSLLMATQRFEQSRVQTDRLRGSVRRVADETARNQARMDSVSQSMHGYKKRLDEAGIGVERLGAKSRELTRRMESGTAEINRQTTALRRQSEVQRRVAELREHHARRMGNIGGMAAAGAGGMVTGYALSRPIGASVRSFVDQETAGMQLRAANMIANGSILPEYQKIYDLAVDLGGKLPGSTTDFLEMMTILRKEGIKANVVLGGTGRAAAYLGVQLQMQSDQAALFAAKMQDVTGTVENDMMGLMDVMQRGFYLGLDDNWMLQGFSRIAPVMSIIKQRGLEAAKTLMPFLVMMNQEGMQEGGSAGNAYRKIFQGTLNIDKIDKANDSLKAKKIPLRFDFTDGKGNFGGIEKMYAELQKLKKIEEKYGMATRLEVTKTIFGDDAETIQVLDSMVTNGIAKYREALQKLKEQADLMTRVNSQLGTTANLWDAAAGAFNNALADVTRTVEPEMKELIKDINYIAESFGNFVKQNPKLVAFFVRMAVVVTAAYVAIGGLMVAAAGVAAPFAVLRFLLARMGIQFITLRGIFAGFFRAMFFLARANPLAAAIIAIGVALSSIVTRWDAIKGLFDRGEWGGLAMEIVAGLEDGLNVMTFGLYGVFKGIVNGLIETFKFILGINSPSRLFYEFGVNIVQGLINGIKGMFSAVGETIKGLADNTVGWFKEKLKINSPSRVFIEAGQFIGEGAAIGMDRTRPMLRAAALGLAGATAVGMPAMATAFDTRPPLAAASSARAPVVMQGDTISLTFNVAPGGESAAQAIARAVRDELDRRDRAKRARLSSSYVDYDNG